MPNSSQTFWRFSTLTSADQAQLAFGRNSMLASMVKSFFAVNNQQETWAIAVDDASGGVAATGKLALSGTVTAAGTLNLYIAGQPVKVAVSLGQNLSTLATAIAAAITAQTDLPSTAAVNGVTDTEIDLTAVHKGLLGNDLDLRLNYYTGETLPQGLTVTITGFSGGTTNPDLAATIAAMGDEQYHTIIAPYTDATSLTAMNTELESRFDAMVDKAGMYYSAAAGTFGELTTLGGTLNNRTASIVGSGNSPTAPWNWAAAYGGLIAKHGAIDPARPFQTLAMLGVLAPASGQSFTQTERNQLLEAGIATFTANAGNVLIERAVTTYKTNAQGIADASYRDVNTLLTLLALRFSVRARISQKFPRTKLAKDGTNFGVGQAIVTPQIIRDELISLFRDWENVGLVEDIEQFKTDLIVEINATDVNRVDVMMPPNLVNQFRVFAGKIEFIL